MLDINERLPDLLSNRVQTDKDDITYQRLSTFEVNSVKSEKTAITKSSEQLNNFTAKSQNCNFNL